MSREKYGGKNPAICGRMGRVNIMLEKIRELYDKRFEFWKAICWLIKQMRAWVWILLGISLLNAALSGMTVVIAAVNKQVVDYATADAPVFHVGFFALLVVVTFANMAFSSGINIGKSFLNEKFAFSMKQRFFRQILRGNWLKLSEFHSGDIMTRITGDMDMVANGMFNILPGLVYTVFQFVIAFSVLWYFDYRMALAAFCLAPLGLLISAGMSNIFARFQAQSRENEAAYRSFMQESMENIVITKSFCQEEASARRMKEFWKIRFGIIKKRSLFGFGLNMAMGLIFSGGYLACFGWCLYRLVQGEITYGTVTMMITMLGQVQTPVQNLQSIVQQMVSTFVSAGRIMDISELEPEDYESPLTVSGSVGVRLRNVSFSYREGEENVLQDLSMEIAPGDMVGIVGASGGGKTTIIRMILSLIQPSEGAVELFDSSGNSCPVAPAARKLISYVPQGNTLISGTIRKNLQMGKPDATEEEMWEALATAEAAAFVREFPLGLDTQILEKGGAVSEGQAQRIAIARAMIKPAAILILDEATASLDMDTEAAIIRNLKNRRAGMTGIVVTHRPSLLQLCERVYRMESGNIQEVRHGEQVEDREREAG